MNVKKSILLCAVAVAMAACSATEGYDAHKCGRLADRVAASQPLGQDDYAEMIAQTEYILDGLIASADSVSSASDDAERQRRAAALRDNTEFLERLGYMFTFSSELYRAHLRGELAETNRLAYEQLDSASERFARLYTSL